MNFKEHNLNLSNEDIAAITASLDLLISNPIEGVSKAKELETKNSAISLRNKLNSRSPVLDAEEMRIAYIALYNWELLINETNSLPTSIQFRNESSKYQTIISRLLSYFGTILGLD